MDLKHIKKLIGGPFELIADSLSEIVNDLDIDKTAKVLDLGTGRGMMAIILALNEYHVLTGEPKEDKTMYAKKDWYGNAQKAEVANLISFKHFEVEKLPFENESFDAIFTYGSFHHFRDKKIALKESLRVLKHDGILCIIEPGPEMIKNIQKRVGNHPDVEDPRNYLDDLSVRIEKIKDSQLIDAYRIVKK
ncbi:MAG: methyltransferase domain-containing protein [Candidatus Lokiarchaeota archaeon]|nr:methyltransferase domain-containing protein [Candidatus Lokiarchaeota archaeon]MBD3340117.1 methyltransferase domain-containing protein [Candidatus Lokiarchaeota archaeon]